MRLFPGIWQRLSGEFDEWETDTYETAHGAAGDRCASRTASMFHTGTGFAGPNFLGTPILAEVALV
jgi:hypothetical protein